MPRSSMPGLDSWDSDPSSANGPQSAEPRPETDFAELRARFAAPAGSLSLGLSSDLALDIVLNEIVEQACLATGASGAAIALKRDQELVCRATNGSTAPELGAPLDSSQGLSGECVRTRQVQVSNDAGTDSRADVVAARRLGVRSVIVLPLIHGAEVVGVLEAFSTRPGAFGERDRRTLEALAQRVLRNVDRAAQPSAEDVGKSAAPASDQGIAQGTFDWEARFSTEAHSTGEVSAEAGSTGEVSAQCALEQDSSAQHSAAPSPQNRPEQDSSEQSSTEQPSSEPQGDGVPFFLPGYGASLGMESQTRLWRLLRPSRAVRIATAVLGLAVLLCAIGMGVLALARLGWIKAGWIKADWIKADSIAADSPEPGSVKDSGGNPAGNAAAQASPRQQASTDATAAKPGTSPGEGSPGQSPPGASPPASPPPGGLVVYQDGKEVFRVAPGQPAPAHAESAKSPDEVAPTGDNAAAKASPALQIAEQDAESSLLRRVEPEYPQEARQLGIQGQVVLDVRIAANGAVEDMQVVRGHPLLVRAAMDAVRQWRFKPRTADGHRVAMETEVTLSFRLPQ